MIRAEIEMDENDSNLQEECMRREKERDMTCLSCVTAFSVQILGW